MKKYTALLICGMLAGCSGGISPREQVVQSNSWEQVGYQDAIIGKHPVAQEELRDNEGQSLTSQQYEQYKSGYTKGNRDFCTPEVARYQGELGNRYDSQCDWSEDFADIVAEWDEGYEDYEAEEGL